MKFFDINYKHSSGQAHSTATVHVKVDAGYNGTVVELSLPFHKMGLEEDKILAKIVTGLRSRHFKAKSPELKAVAETQYDAADAKILNIVHTGVENADAKISADAAAKVVAEQVKLEVEKLIIARRNIADDNQKIKPLSHIKGVSYERSGDNGVRLRFDQPEGMDINIAESKIEDAVNAAFGNNVRNGVGEALASKGQPKRSSHSRTGQ